MRRPDSRRRAVKPQWGGEKITVFRDEARYKCLRMMCSRPETILKIQDFRRAALRFTKRRRDLPGRLRVLCAHTSPSFQDKHPLTPLHTPWFAPELLSHFASLQRADVSLSPPLLPLLPPAGQRSDGLVAVL